MKEEETDQTNGDEPPITDSELDPLAEYRRKRDPAATNEPFQDPPVLKGDARDAREGQFVVQLHHATRVHYDLRLEVAGVLESFAVPKGPSQNPADKRLAIHTEAHPMRYLDFEAVIPDGQYGAGPMIAWDRGRVRYPKTSPREGLENGKLSFELYGRRLRGGYTLIRTRGRGGRSFEGSKEAWLLIKKRDDEIDRERDVRERYPQSVYSGLTIEELPSAPERYDALLSSLAESGARRGTVAVENALSRPTFVKTLEVSANGVELRGARVLVYRRGSEVALYDSLGRSVEMFDELRRAFACLSTTSFVLDGEITCGSAAGLAARIAGAPIHAHAAHFRAFDLLSIGPYDLRSCPREERAQRLREVVPAESARALLSVAEPAGDAPRGPVLTVDDGAYGCVTVSVSPRVMDFVVVGESENELALASYVGARLRFRGSAPVSKDLRDALSLSRVDEGLSGLPPRFDPVAPQDVVRVRGTFIEHGVLEVEEVLGTSDVEVAYVTSGPVAAPLVNR